MLCHDHQVLKYADQVEYALYKIMHFILVYYGLAEYS